MIEAETAHSEIQSETESQYPAWPKTLRYLGIVILLIAAVALLYLLSPILSILILAFLFTFVIDLPARYASRRTRLSYTLSAALIYLALFAILAATLFIGVPKFIESLEGLLTTIENASQTLISQHESSPETTDSISAAVFDTISNNPTTLLNIIEEAVKFVVKIIQIPVTLLGNFVRVLVFVGFSVFLAMLVQFNLRKSRGGLARWFPAVYGKEVSLLLAQLDLIWVRFMGAQAVYALVLGTGSAIEYLIFGVPFPIAMAVLTAIVSLIPTIGGALASLIVAIPCLLLGSTRFPDLSPVVFAIAVFLINGLITQVSYNFVLLPLLSKAVKLPFWVVLTGVTLGMATGNILLAFLVVPVFSTIRLFWNYILTKASNIAPFPPEEEPPQLPTGIFTQMYYQHGD